MKTKNNYQHKLFSIFLGNTEFSQDKNSFIVISALYFVHKKHIWNKNI